MIVNESYCMKGRKQKISEDSYPEKDRRESKGHPGVQTFMWITENNITNFTECQYGLLEQILSPNNLNMAYKRVQSNKGKGGVDEMEVDSLCAYLIANKDRLLETILSVRYSLDSIFFRSETVLQFRKGLPAIRSNAIAMLQILRCKIA